MDLQDFEDHPSRMVYCKLRPTVSRRKSIKTLKAVSKGVIKTPLNLSIYRDRELHLSSSDLVDIMVEGDECKPVLITNEMYEEIFGDGGNGDWITYKNLGFLDHPYSDDLPSDRVLSRVIVPAWLTVKQRKGELPPDCAHCEDALELNNDLCCRRCGVEVEIENQPKSMYKYYEEVVAYENGSGNEVLPRVA